MNRCMALSVFRVCLYVQFASFALHRGPSHHLVSISCGNRDNVLRTAQAALRAARSVCFRLKYVMHLAKVCTDYVLLSSNSL